MLASQFNRRQRRLSLSQPDTVHQTITTFAIHATENMDDIYDAVPLAHGTSTNIRVIEILDSPAGETDSLIACKFHTTSLNDAPAYTALSYTWGSPDDTRMIELDGKAFEVRRNLWDFLDEARRRKDTRSDRLWIDAICIHQAHVSERNHQVGMMGEIYSKAAKVVAWLGSDNPIVELDISLTHGRDLEYLMRDLRTSNDARWQEQFDAIQELSARAYWKRLWILQEFVLAREIEIWCGQQTISEEALRWILDSVRSSSHTTPALKIVNCRHARRFSSARMSLEQLLNEFGQNMECADVRDHVYALISLMDERQRERLGIDPNYSCSPAELLEELLLAYKRTGRYHKDRMEEISRVLRRLLKLKAKNYGEMQEETQSGL
jgi:hypothetical protein